MNIQLIAEQIGRIHLTLETTDAFEVYGGTWLGAFEVSQTGTAQWTLTVREQVVAAAPLRDYKVYARQLATGREWEVLSGKLLVSARTAAVPADKLAPVEYFVTVPVVDHDVDAVGSTIVQGIPGPQGPKGDKGDPGEGGMTEEERTKLAGAAQRDASNTFTAANTFTGSVDMRGASVMPPEGWNVEGVTAEQVQAVVPMAFGEYTTAPSCTGAGSIVLGDGAKTDKQGVAIGGSASSLGEQGVAIGAGAKVTSSQGTSVGFNARSYMYSVACGCNAIASGGASIAVGGAAQATKIKALAVGDGAVCSGTNGIAVGSIATTKTQNAITFGSHFTENVDGTNVTHTCTTEGTGSITIGAGANTLNNGTTESSNSVTIGCKAENKGADSVVIGATATTAGSGNVIIGAAASSGSEAWIKESVAIGKGATVNGTRSVAIRGSANGNATVAIGGSAAGSGSVVIGGVSKSTAGNAIAVGNYDTITSSPYAVALGMGAKAANYGVIVIRSTAEDGTYTQLYFSGANTPLANTYEGGEAMMGYVVRDSAGNVMVDAEGNAMVGTQKLSVLFPNNRGENAFTPAMLSLDEDWTPKPMFHPSDLDMPTEEPSEPEEYTPLPVWPIVEPEVPEDLPPHGDVAKS